MARDRRRDRDDDDDDDRGSDGGSDGGVGGPDADTDQVDRAAMTEKTMTQKKTQTEADDVEGRETSPLRSNALLSGDYWEDDEFCENCSKVASECWCCDTCGAIDLQSCICCPHCHGVGQRALLSGIEWNYVGSDYGTCLDCQGTGHI